MLYVLTKTNGDKVKGSKWMFVEEAWAEDTREIVTTTTLPFGPLAVVGTFYNVANGILKKAVEGNKYETIGKIIEIPNPNQTDLPNIEKVVLPEGTVYVLTKADGTKTKGSKWMFDFTAKEFKSYPPVTASGDPMQDTDDNV